jgi:hypothetical protein
MTSYFGEYLVQLLPADGWGMVVWWPDDADATCEPLVAWALVERMSVTAEGEERGDDDAYDRHFRRRHERTVEGLIVAEGSPSTLAELHLLYAPGHPQHLGYCRLTDFRSEAWATAVEQARTSHQRAEAKAAES